MAEKVVLVCDVCGAEPAQTVALRVGRLNWLKDLCRTHLTELLSAARRPRRGRQPSARVKRATRKRTTRKPAPSVRKRPTVRKRATRTRRSATTPDVAAQVKKLRDGGLSYRQIGDTLMKRGIKPQRAKRWNPIVLGRMLKRSAA